MPRGVLVHRFGSFELDLASRRLFRGDEQVRLFEAQAAILVHLVEHAGEVIPKDTLVRVGWPRTAVTDNNLDQAISRIRRRFVEAGDAREYIETVPHRGYRFIGVVTTAHRAIADPVLDEHLEPYRALVHERTQLDFLDRERARRARAEIEKVMQQAPDCVAAGFDLGMACALLIEAAGADLDIDPAILEAGIASARSSCARHPASAEGWATLAILLRQQGKREDAMGAVARALELDAEDWRHAIRAAYVGWGEERLRHARRVLTVYPRFTLAHWLRTTVFIARGAHDVALAEAELGCAAQDAQSPESFFPGVGMHLHRGHLLAARGRLDDAVAEFDRELAHVTNSQQIYAPECAANTWYALGAVRRRQGLHGAADTAFRRALAIAPAHVSAAAALHGTFPSHASPADPMRLPSGRAIVLAREGRHGDAARVFLAALRDQPPGPAGWILSVEPTLDTAAHGDVWTEALALIRSRAS